MSPNALQPWTVGAVTFLTTVCTTPLMLAQPFAAHLGYSAPCWYAIAILVGLLGAHLNARIAEVEVGLLPWQAGVRRTLDRLRVPFYLLGAAFMLSGWLNVLAATDLPYTPRAVTALLNLTVVAYSVRMGLFATTRLVGLLALMVTPIGLLILLGLAPGMRLGNALPLALPAGSWIVPTVLFVTRGYDVLPVLGAHTVGNLRTPALVGVGAGAVMLGATLTASVLVFGLAATTQMAYPFVRTLGTISSLYLPFQRPQFVTFILWEMISFGVVAIYSIAGIASLGVRVHPLTGWWPVAAWTATVFLMALYRPTPDLMIALATVWSAYGLLLFVVAPSLVLAFGGRRQPVPA